MADITENDDELIPVETPIEDKEPDTKGAEVDDQDEDDEDDARMAQSEDDNDEEITASRRRRLQRRDARKRARDRNERELAMLREQVAILSQRVGTAEQHSIGSGEAALQSKLQEAISRVQMAEQIIAKATEAGNGEDVVAAMRMRDAAQAEAAQFHNAAQQFQQQRQAAPVGRVQTYAREWVSANPWYDPSGNDADSALAKQVDAQLAREGFDPNTRAYWEELSARVSDAFAEREDTGHEAPARQRDGNRRNAPPIGTSREHAPVSTRKEIYVTPERKQAMIEAGAWDDPVKRQRMLKAYQDFDRGSARR